MIILTLFDLKCSITAIIARERGVTPCNSLCRRGRLRMKAERASGISGSKDFTVEVYERIGKSDIY